MCDFLTRMIYSGMKIFIKLMKGFKKNKSIKISYITLERLLSTFQSISILIKNGFYYETICLYRVVLEQIAYAYQCSKTEPEKVDNVQAKSSVTELKKIFESAGPLNGLFSKYIHHNKSIWGDFIDDENYIISRSAKRSKRNILYMVVLVEMYITVLDEVYKNVNKDNKMNKDFHNFKIFVFKMTNKIKSHFKASSDDFL